MRPLPSAIAGDSEGTGQQTLQNRHSLFNILASRRNSFILGRIPVVGCPRRITATLVQIRC
ncbi:hypothetical protein, partial [Telmatospirillum sp.]|uniref:hypothetical protein n=1 Tax=Telmatospirillum sp. TaxID=2079197 RepID=UPI00284B733D